MTPIVSGSTQCKEIDQDSSLCQCVCVCVCVCVLVEGGIQFSAPYQHCQRTQLESEKGKRSLGLIFY